MSWSNAFVLVVFTVLVLSNSLAAQIQGQSLALELLARILASGRVAPAYLFAGPRGVGKATTARQFAADLLNCKDGRVWSANHPDLLWVEPTYQKGDRLYTVEQARAENITSRALPQIRLAQVHALIRFLARSPVEAPRQVIVIEAAETLGAQPANALLKTLEEPGNGVFILLVPEVLSIPGTVVSRCQRVPFTRLSDRAVNEILASRGHLDIPQQVLAMAQGSPGEALELIEWFDAMPADLLNTLDEWSAQAGGLRTALELARRIDHDLPPEQQNRLVDYLQHAAWQHRRTDLVHALEALRRHLHTYISPRLAWEVALGGLKTAF